MIPREKSYLKWIESAIERQKYGKEPSSLYEPIRYLMGLGGKRLRPRLTLHAYSLFRDDVRRIVPFAVAVEAFHNFTLMHDDIMDKAPLRRGKKTVHEKWNVNTAILSGDVMLVKVYDMFLGLDRRLLGDVMKAFNACAVGVCEGQQLDMEFESRRTVSEAEYLEMIRKKTAVLLGFSLELGALLANAKATDRKWLRAFGTNIGIAFQLTDDLLDAYADPKKFGKQVGGDIIANKKTYLLIKALELAKGKDRRELTHWIALQNFDSAEKVATVKSIYDRLGVRELTARKIERYFKRGFENLTKVMGNPANKRALEEFTKGLVERQY